MIIDNTLHLEPVILSLITIILGLVASHLFIVLIDMLIYRFKYKWPIMRYLNETSKPYVNKK